MAVDEVVRLSKRPLAVCLMAPGPRCSDTVALLLLYKARRLSSNTVHIYTWLYFIMIYLSHKQVMYPESLFLLRSNHERPVRFPCSLL